MKRISFALFFLYFYLPILAAPEQLPVDSDGLTNGLEDFPPPQRVIQITRCVDSLEERKTPLLRLSEFLDDMRSKARAWNDQPLLKHLAFYHRIKRIYQPITQEEFMNILESTINYYEDKGIQRYVAVCHFYIGNRFYEQEQYGEAFYHHARALALFDKVGIQHIPEIGKYLHRISLNYYYFRDYERVVELMRASISQPYYNTNLVVQRYNTLAMAYLHLNELDSAIRYFKHTQEVANSLHNETWITISAGNLGRVYLKQGRYEDALPLQMQDYLYNRNREYDPIVARNAAINVASTLQKLDRQDSVMYYLGESERLNRLVKSGNPMWGQQRDEEFYITYYGVLHDYYKTKGNTLVAYRYLDSLTKLTNETNLTYNKMTAQVAEDRLKIQQHVADLAIQQADKERIRFRLLGVIGIVVLLLFIMAMLYYLLRLRRSKERLHVEKERIIQQAAQEKVEAQLAQATLELKEYMHRLQEKNELVKTFRKQVEQLRNHTMNQSPQLDELTNRLAETKLLTPDDWNNFRQRFNRAFGGELDQLKLKHRDLTSAEERIYALEKMNVSTSHMAWMLGISPESVRKARYRLRKKIDLSVA
ncbi:tetratricopeptide repeat protein [Parapedobacter indicus]|uniref:Tetratricopeptide repeat-containing protein n=1 Tax=Parapedobacter indicus TaxID=1477437 RepID=A0A1I3QKX8_9SPHI|nr:tetratricopeptide repeat protein [Parapedobacter indicus]PPL00142.1 tetratricopeptide repeat protein [Parapedobacter indicus]SFJ34222.1 Tetratricopeptide repeat-containing protein [Parapedobacter indicus]